MSLAVKRSASVLALAALVGCGGASDPAPVGGAGGTVGAAGDVASASYTSASELPLSAPARFGFGLLGGGGAS